MIQKKVYGLINDFVTEIFFKKLAMMTHWWLSFEYFKKCLKLKFVISNEFFWLRPIVVNRKFKLFISDRLIFRGL